MCDPNVSPPGGLTPFKLNLPLTWYIILMAAAAPNIPVFRPLFVAHGISLYGTLDPFDTTTEQIRFDDHTIYLRASCICMVRNKKTREMRHCCGQTFALYCIDATNPTRRVCPLHYRKEHEDTLHFCTGMSQTLNDICDRLGATGLQRETDLTMQHINHFLGDPIATHTLLINSERILQFLRANCSGPICAQIEARSMLNPAATASAFIVRHAAPDEAPADADFDDNDESANDEGDGGEEDDDEDDGGDDEDDGPQSSDGNFLGRARIVHIAFAKGIAPILRSWLDQSHQSPHPMSPQLKQKRSAGTIAMTTIDNCVARRMID